MGLSVLVNFSSIESPGKSAGKRSACLPWTISRTNERWGCGERFCLAFCDAKKTFVRIFDIKHVTSLTIFLSLLVLSHPQTTPAF